MEQWIIDAKDRARVEAECLIENLKAIAEEENLDPLWFIDEVVKNIHCLKSE